MTKRFFRSMLLTITIIVVGIGIVCMRDDWVFLKHKIEVIDYLSSQYHGGLELRYSKVGKTNYPAERTPDQYVFFDPEVPLFFQVDYEHNEIVDYYADALKGKKISDEISILCHNTGLENHLIRCWNSGNPNDFTEAQGQLILFCSMTNSHRETICSLIRCIAETYKGLTLTLVVSKPENRSSYENLFSYETVVPISDLPHSVFYTICTNLMGIHDADAFYTYMDSVKTEP